MIELNGIQISDNNINTKKNVKIYVDEKQLDNKVGELQDLETTNKSSIVNAINEIKNTTNTLQVDVNRIYSDFTIIPNTPTEQEFTYKKSDEGVIEKGVAVIDKVKGNSVVWNQKVKNATFINTSKWDATYSIFSVSGGIASVTASADGDNYTQQLVPMVVSHKYLYTFMAAPDTANKNHTCAYIFYGNSSNFKTIKAKDDTNWHTYNAIVTCVSNTHNIVRLEVTKVGTSQFKNVSLIDLTQMFGAGNEPTTYEEFLSRKPKVADEYAYNEGTIINNKVEAVVTTGRNIWDEEWEVGSLNGVTGQPMSASDNFRSKNYCPILGSTEYYLTSASFPINLFYYDKDKNFLVGKILYGNNIAFTTPEDAAYFKVRTDSPNNIYNHDICINLSDPTINGQYFPYEKHELDLAWIKEIKDAEGVKLFEDGMKSAGTTFDEVGKNKAVKRIRVVDLGSLDWIKYTEANHELFQTKGLVGLIMVSSATKVANMTCNKYNALPVNDLYNHNGDGIGVNEIGTIDIYDKALIGKTAEDFKTAMQGVTLYYELAEPIVVEQDEKNLTYPVIAGGTEEAIASEPSTHMRASITYGSNTVATILSLMNRVNELERKIIN